MDQAVRYDQGSWAIARAGAALVPALMLAYPVLIFPLLNVVPVDPVTGLQTASGEVHSNLLNRLYYPPLLLISFACFVASGRRGAPAMVPIVLAIAVFGALCAMSVFWAIAPEIALRRFIAQSFIVLSIIFAVAAVDEPEEVLEPIFWVVVLTVIFNLHAVATQPRGPLGYEGIYGHKNMLGASMSLAGFVGLWRLVSPGLLSRAVAAAVLAISMVLLVLSESKTSFGFFLLAPGLGLLLCGASRILHMSAVVPVLAVFVSVWFGYALTTEYLLLDFGDVMGILTGDPTLTDRTTIWRFAGEVIARAPWLGYGYGSFWQIGTGVPSFNEAPGFVSDMPHAHNGYIDIVLQVGFVGLILFMPIVLVGIHLAGSLARQRWRLAWLLTTLILFVMLHNLLETSWAYYSGDLWILFVLSVLLAARARHDPLPLAA